MLGDKYPYSFHYVILRYVPDFARGEFVNGGIIFHDAHEQRIFGKVYDRESKYKNIDRDGYYKYFIEATEDLINGLYEEVKEIKQEHHGDEAAILVEKAFVDAVIPNAGFLGFSNIRSGVTDNILAKFHSLYKRYVDDLGSIEPEQEKKPSAKVELSILEPFLKELIVPPDKAAFPYDATGGTYLFDTSFRNPYHVYLKTVRMRQKKNGTVEWGNVLRNLVVLSDLKVAYPDYTFGILLYFLYQTPDIDREKRLEGIITSLTARFRQANVDLLMAKQRDVETYLRTKGLLKKPLHE
ncbi:MAG: DUF3037 domain-containing protein [Dissulfurispiraceae bacterium]